MEKTAPIAVYTSGKGSSAAGLTASVIRDSSTVCPMFSVFFCLILFFLLYEVFKISLL